MLDLAQQVAPPVDLARRVADFAQYLTAAGVIGIIALVSSLRDRVGRIETTLSRFHLIDEQGSQHSVTLAQHETRLDGHDSQIGRIDAAIAQYPAPQHSRSSRQ
jgi:hypothetical protein